MRRVHAWRIFWRTAAGAAALLAGGPLQGDGAEPRKGFLVTNSDPDELVLARDGRTDCRVVIAESADPQVKAVAADFVQIFQEMTGAEIPLVTDAAPMGAHEILIGPSRHLDELCMYIDWEALGEEGYVIRTRSPSPLHPGGPHLALFGGPMGGTRNAVYTFLDEHLGRRFYSSNLTVIPTRPDLRIGILHEEAAPAFKWRRLSVSQSPDHARWRCRTRLNTHERDIWD